MLTCDRATHYFRGGKERFLPAAKKNIGTPDGRLRKWTNYWNWVGIVTQ